MQWLVSALNTVEPCVINLSLINLFHTDHQWAKLRRSGAPDLMHRRLSALSNAIGDKPFLDGERFTAGDLVMSAVLRILDHTDLVSNDRCLATYAERCTGSVPFKRALDVQLKDLRQAA
ncbi:MAG: hypothetical protein ACREHF_05795 [Rhizomicrobium sp.]